jgi:hypothetical protein
MRRLAFCFVLLSACAVSEPWPAHYLSSGLDRATQDEVTVQLGPPYETHSLPDGGTEWHYHQRRGRPMIGPHGTMGGSTSLECEEYVLRFDHTGVLRGWDQLMERTCEPQTQHHPSHGLAARG